MQQKKLPRISESEWLVMQVIWARRRATTNEVVEELTPRTQWAPKTIMTLLKRLVDKGALGFEARGRLYEYHALAREQDCTRAERRSFLQRVYGGSLTPMLSQFIEETKLSQAEIDELKRLLDQKGKK